jgi:hypothetical protein
MRRGRGGAVDQGSNEVGSSRRASLGASGQVRTPAASVDLSPTPAQQHRYWSRFVRRFGWVLLVVACLLLFLGVTMAIPVEGLLWLPMLALAALLLVALPVGLIVAAFPGRTRGGVR